VGGRTLEGSIAAAAYRGRISYVGSAGRDAFVPNPDQLRPGEKALTGIFFGARKGLEHPRRDPLIQPPLEDVARGALQIVVDRTFPLAEAAAAHAFIEGRQAFGRVVLIP